MQNPHDPAATTNACNCPTGKEYDGPLRWVVITPDWPNADQVTSHDSVADT